MSGSAVVSAPLYAKVKFAILARIDAGELQVGDRVPSENELVKAMRISRMTAHRALRDLTRDGILERHTGVGTFVADRRALGHPFCIRNIADEIQDRGHIHSAKVLTLRAEPASDDVARALDLPPRTRVLHSCILHLENGAPVQLEDRWVNALLAPKYLEQDFVNHTPYEYLTRVAPLQEVEHRVLAVSPDAITRRRLQMHKSEPCLLVRRRTWAKKRVASLALLYHPGSRFELGGRFRP
jgi:GntR family transcriptional regulator, histidine utilization repressor